MNRPGFLKISVLAPILAKLLMRPEPPPRYDPEDDRTRITASSLGEDDGTEGSTSIEFFRGGKSTAVPR